MMTAQLIGELTREAAVTRTVLERVPEDRLTWRPHPKSMSLGELAMHIAVLPLGIAELLDELVREIPDVPRIEAKSREELLAALDRSLATATGKLWEWGDRGLGDTWRMTSEGRTLIESSRLEVVRGLMLNHWYHHRGQLTVYLRLLDVALPPVYGPTADANALG